MREESTYFISLQGYKNLITTDLIYSIASKTSVKESQALVLFNEHVQTYGPHI